MANISREMANFPKPSLNWGKHLSSESMKGVGTSGSKTAVKDLLKSQMPAGNLPGESLKTASQNIILDSNTLNSFFKRLGDYVGH